MSSSVRTIQHIDGCPSGVCWFIAMVQFCGLVVSGERFMSPLHLHRPPPKSPWWRRYWDSFKRNFPDRSGEQARSFVLLLIAAASIWLLSRIILATFWSGLPGPYSK